MENTIEEQELSNTVELEIVSVDTENTVRARFLEEYPNSQVDRVVLVRERMIALVIYGEELGDQQSLYPADVVPTVVNR
jgi:hypothetical protein